MAKRKTGKRKVEDLRPQNVTQEELQNLQNIVNALNRAQLEIGSLETRKHSLCHQVISLQTQIATLQKGFEETYGKADINITDGTITYIEDEQADKKD
tara:strand:+ start:1565 stop:1858 length:294 start_codon:yes stop_codon:yes gene_type:complete